MREVHTSEKRPNPVRLALAIGLTVVFVVVVVVQVRSYSGDASVVAEAGAAAVSNVDSDSADGSISTQPGASEPEHARVVWPAVDLDQCIEHDPFATSDEFVAKREEQAEVTIGEDARMREIELARERAAREQALSELMEAGVNAILKGPDGSMAILETGTIRVGEEIHGHRVVAIEPDGIVLEPITNE